MSGASANAAARRRRGVSQSSNNYTTQSQEKVNLKPTESSNVPKLTVPQILFQLDQRISKIEHKFSTPVESMLDINGNIDVNLLPQKIGDLEKKLLSFEQTISTLEKNISDNVISRINNLSSSITSIESKIENIDLTSSNNSVSKEQFDNIMSNVGVDVGVLTEQVTDLKDLVLNVQNSTILLDKTIIELSNDFRANKLDNKQTQSEIEMEKEMEQDIISGENIHNTSEIISEQPSNEDSNIELQINEKQDEQIQEAVKEEVSEVINDELIQKLKMLNSVGSQDEKDIKIEEQEVSSN